MRCTYCPDGCTQQIHLAGVATAPAATAEGQAAKAWTQAWLAVHAPAQPPALIVTTDRVRCGCPGQRYTATVHAPDGACLNTDLLRSGHAHHAPG